MPPAEQAAWISRALHRLWVAGVGLVAWQFLADPYPALTYATPTGGLASYPRPAGLYAPGPGGSLAAAQPKPFLTGFRFPFDPVRVDRRRVRIWALTAAGARVEVLLASHGVWRVLASVRASGAGVLNALITLRGAGSLRLHIGTSLSAAEPLGAGVRPGTG